jgi:hypothetical protein
LSTPLIPLVTALLVNDVIVPSIISVFSSPETENLKCLTLKPLLTSLEDLCLGPPADYADPELLLNPIPPDDAS